ncbi:MAG: LysR substrate-binding domain-containing protein [Methylococcales bacterium]
MKQANYLNSLKALEATCRLGSYAKASHELFVTPEAVGQLIRKLESHLNTKLFNRDLNKKKLIPIPEVLELLPNLTEAFRHLSLIERRLVGLSENSQLIISAPPSLASKWLIPRLDSIRGLLHDENIRLNVTSDLVDFNSREADVAIRYGTGHWNDLITHKILGNEKLFPVCSKHYLEKTADLNIVNDLKKNTLIKDNTIKDPTYPSWLTWFRMFGDNHQPDEIRFLEFNNTLMAIDAAISGQGIALAREYLVKDELKSGNLIRIFGELEIDSSWGYYIVMPYHSSDKAKLFFDWFSKCGEDL